MSGGDRMRVKELRKRLGLTQRKLAFALSVSEQTISNWEVGRELPKGIMQAVIRRAKQLAETKSGAKQVNKALAADSWATTLECLFCCKRKNRGE